MAITLQQLCCRAGAIVALMLTTSAAASGMLAASSSSSSSITTTTTMQQLQQRILQQTSAAAGQFPIESYYIPLKESDLLATMDDINTDARSPVISITSIAIAADDTIIWYDHHEDGYEDDITDVDNLQSSTEVWGDGLASNGCAFGVDPCTDEADRLTAGMAINIINDVPVPYTSDQWRYLDGSNGGYKYDGGDRVDSTFPVAVTRGAYPHNAANEPLPLFAGAVEVLNTENYGTEFITPVGTDTVTGGNAFEQSELYVMARGDGTTITWTKANGGETVQYTINAGENRRIPGIREGDRITANANNPVQVHLITGDVGSNYELRWFSLLPTSQWDHKYYTPVGDSNNAGASQVGSFIYNPGDNDIVVKFNRGEGSAESSGQFLVPAKSTELHATMDHSDKMTGYEYYTDDPADVFFGVVVVDTQSSWQAFDWGHTLVPENQLSSQVIVGDGRRCLDPKATNCNTSSQSRNYVYLTPVADAKVWVDYDSDGSRVDTFDVKRLNTLQLGDVNDNDMSGAYIWATVPNANQDGDTVDMAVAWGQLPYESGSTQTQSVQLDMGTWQKGVAILRVLKSCSLSLDRDGRCGISPGDELMCTIKIINTGQKTIDAILLNETLDGDVIYSDDTTSYELKGSSPTPTPVPIVDQPGTGTDAFPLGGSGSTLSGLALKRFDELLISYKMNVKNVTDLSSDFSAVLMDTGAVFSGDFEYSAVFESFIEVETGCEPSAAPTSTPYPTKAPIITPSPTTGAPTQAPIVATEPPTVFVPQFSMVASTADNTVCRAVTVTATETFELRGYSFYVNSTDCLEVEVLVSIDGGPHVSYCLGYTVGAGPDAETFVPSIYCTMLEVHPGESIDIQINSEPSDQCRDGLEWVMYPPRQLEYTYEYTTCI